MPSLFDSLGIAFRSLQAQQTGLEVTQRNISNAATPGYSRQRANLVPGNEPSFGFIPQGTGPAGVSIESFRDRFGNQRVVQELHAKGKFESIAEGLRQVETFLNENENRGLGLALSSFFNSFSSLSVSPEDSALRQQVLAESNRLTREIGHVYEQLQSVQAFQDEAVSTTVDEVNSLTDSIARLNVEVAHAKASAAADASVMEDQRQIQIERLAELIGISFFETESGSVTIITGKGPTLVVGDESQPLQVNQAAGGNFLGISASNIDITGTIDSGKLAGLLDLRDNKIAGYLGALDDLAATITAEVNAQHALGVDLSGTAGGDFFVPFVPIIPGSNTGAARSMTVAITDPNAIAAAGPGAGPGDNTNAALLAAIAEQKLFSSTTADVHEFYADLVFDVGSDLQTSENEFSIEQQVLTQLRNRRDSISAVNLDEEAVNIIRFQKAYEASARFARTIDELTEELVRLLGGP